MILGLGTDIVEIQRFDRANIERMAERILTVTEQVTFQQHKQPIAFLAKRWAAKEAAAKALGTGIAAGVTFQDFTIENDQNGKPELTLSGQAKLLLQAKAGEQVIYCHISLSDEKHYATATVIFEKRA